MNSSEAGKRSQRRDEKKKKIRLKNINVPLNFRPPILPETTNDEMQITQVLDYCENDFPALRCEVALKSKKNRSTIHQLEDETDNAANQLDHAPDWKSSKKILKSYKHKEAYKVPLEEIFLNSSKPNKQKIRPVYHHKEDVSLSGNPLDSDNPVRQKGIINNKAKVKRPSKTKAMVCKAREEMQRWKEIAKCISVEGDQVQNNNDVSVDELWKPLCLLKAKDIKKCLQNDQIRYEDEEVDNSAKMEASRSSDATNENLVDSFSQNVKCEFVSSADNQLYEQEISRSSIPLKEVLQNSEIPPFKLLIHSSNFKRYCDNFVTSELKEITEKLISQLVRYQYKKHQIDPLKAASKKRYVLGLRQVKKYVIMNKVKLIVLVPNMEESLCETVEELKTLATAYSIPYLFAFTRKKLGKLVYKKIGVSCLGILDYSGAEENFKKCIEVLMSAKKMYSEKCSDTETYYERRFGNSTNCPQNNQITHDISEEIRSDFISKLSLLQENDELDKSEDTDAE